MIDCLTTPQHKNNSGIECQTNDILELCVSVYPSLFAQKKETCVIGVYIVMNYMN